MSIFVLCGVVNKDLKYNGVNGIVLGKTHWASPAMLGSVPFRVLVVQLGTKDLFWVMHSQAHDLRRTSICTIKMISMSTYVYSTIQD